MPDTKTKTKPDTTAQNWVVTTNQLAELLGVGDRHIRTMANNGMPRIRRGTYHAPTCIQWYLGQKIDGETRDRGDQRTKLYAAQTEKLQTETRRLKETLLDADVVSSEMYELASLVATQIDAVEPRITRTLPPESRPLLRAELKAVRTAIADHVETHARTRDSSSDHPAAA